MRPNMNCPRVSGITQVTAAVAKAWQSLPEKRNWQTEFFTGFNIPGSAEFALRIQMNMRRFQHNYIYVFAAGIVRSLLTK